MSTIEIVAILGSTKSGKSTVAEYMVQHHGYTRVRFAQPLKDMLMTLGLTLHQVDGPQEVRSAPIDLLCGKSPRHAMQTLGTEWRDTIHPCLWARITRARISKMIEKGTTKFVIDDMRFPHEAEMFREIGCRIIAIRRPEMEPSLLARFFSHIPMPSVFRSLALLLFGWRSVHVSETSWFKIEPDCEIDNTGTLDDLYDRVDKCISASD